MKSCQEWKQFNYSLDKKSNYFSEGWTFTYTTDPQCAIIDNSLLINIYQTGSINRTVFKQLQTMGNRQLLMNTIKINLINKSFILSVRHINRDINKQSS
ncbi:unnamed protein product (macronuclear) [Paramecium tetraurelia]|uniref:Uncharacterized protein n=1 Tax=Paramecium tetraurelia TaxID=5888 RepID=A0BDC4_PARTE|nr:uncharacterized protein GSPATT00027569001 [Paramecium tetraurelia]CAK56541.1 unnamed protein product [Paramecium tetraurelia]|eukprot:XP_001423939.1 hypothetical protein (macronuclear) [Paramecium tetraurelia strain d4-2]